MTAEIERLIAALQRAGEQILAFAPRFVLAFVILIAGWLLARGVEQIARRLLRRARVDEAAERAGVEGFLLQGGVQFTTATLLAKSLYWLLILLVLLAVLSTLGLSSASRLVERLVVLVPNLAAIFIVVVIGGLLGQFAEAVAFSYLSNVGIPGARGISLLARYAILVVVVALGLEELAVGGQILLSAFQIAFGGICLGLAIAFGLGGRRWAARVLDSWLSK